MGVCLQGHPLHERDPAAVLHLSPRIQVAGRTVLPLRLCIWARRGVLCLLSGRPIPHRLEDQIRGMGG